MKIKLGEVEAFKGTQATFKGTKTFKLQPKWAIAIFAAFILIVGGIFIAVFSSLKNSEAYQLTVSFLNASPLATQLLGQPITTGIPSGSIHVSGAEGEAHLSFSAEGPQSHGTVYVEASKPFGRWRLDEVILEDSRSKQRVDLLK